MILNLGKEELNKKNFNEKHYKFLVSDKMYFGKKEFRDFLYSLFLYSKTKEV